MTHDQAVPNAADIIKQLKQHLPAILREHPVVLAYLYGSVAEGCPTPLSDIDIALVLAPDTEMSLYERFMVELEIGAELEARSGLAETDVRFINDAPVAVVGVVLTEGQLLYSADEMFRVEFETLGRKRYFDFQPTLEMMERAYYMRTDHGNCTAN